MWFNGSTVQRSNCSTRLVGLGIRYHIGSPKRLYVHIVENYVDVFEFNVSKICLRGT